MSEEIKTNQQPEDITHPEDNGAATGKTFTQDEVNRIVSDRLAREREKQTQPPQADEREKALKARETRLDCRDYLDSKKYPAELLDVLDSSDAETFKAAAESLMKAFPAIGISQTPPPYASGTGTAPMYAQDAAIAKAFRPKI